MRSDPRSVLDLSEIASKNIPLLVGFSGFGVEGYLVHWWEEDDNAFVMTTASGELIVLREVSRAISEGIELDDYRFDLEEITKELSMNPLTPESASSLLSHLNFMEDILVSLGGKRLRNISFLNDRLMPMCFSTGVWENPLSVSTDLVLAAKEKRYIRDVFKRLRSRLDNNISVI